MIGLPRKSMIFFLGSRLEPPRAGMIATALMACSFEVGRGYIVAGGQIASEFGVGNGFVLIRSQSIPGPTKQDLCIVQPLTRLDRTIGKNAPANTETTRIFGLVNNATRRSHRPLHISDRLHELLHFDWLKR